MRAAKDPITALLLMEAGGPSSHCSDAWQPFLPKDAAGEPCLRAFQEKSELAVTQARELQAALGEELWELVWDECELEEFLLAKMIGAHQLSRRLALHHCYFATPRGEKRRREESVSD